MARTQVFGFEAPGGKILGLGAKSGASMPGMISMTIVDSAGLSSDTMTAEFDNRSMMVEPPRKGVTIHPFGGYAEGTPKRFGAFIVDQVTWSGYPHKISISAQSVDAKGGAKKREAKGYPARDFPTIGDIANDIAGEASMPISIRSEISGLANEGEFRSEEEALGFLQRVVAKFDATVTVKSGKIIVVPKGHGASFPMLRVGPGVILSYTTSEGDKVQHSEVESASFDRKKGEVKLEAESTGLQGPKLKIQPTFMTPAHAKAAAKAKANQIKRASKTAQFTVDGNPEMQAEMLISVFGLPSVCNGVWRVKTATHNFSASSPYTTSLDCEVPT